VTPEEREVAVAAVRALRAAHGLAVLLPPDAALGVRCRVLVKEVHGCLCASLGISPASYDPAAVLARVERAIAEHDRLWTEAGAVRPWNRRQGNGHADDAAPEPAPAPAEGAAGGAEADREAADRARIEALLRRWPSTGAATLSRVLGIPESRCRRHKRELAADAAAALAAHVARGEPVEADSAPAGLPAFPEAG
jgi:hypothetical protein